MTEELRAQMEALREVAPRLHKASDESSKAIMAANDFLREIGVGFSLYTSSFGEERHGVDNETGLYTSQSQHLAYGRMNGEFRIHVMNLTGTLNPPKDPEATWDHVEERIAWQSCPLSVKLEAITKLPELLARISSSAVELLQNAEKATSTVQGLMDNLGRPTADLDPRKMDISPAFRDAVSYPDEVPPTKRKEASLFLSRTKPRSK